MSSGGEGGRGFWTQNLVYQKWPDQIFPIVNFVFSRDGHFGLGRGGGGFGGGVPPPPLGFNYSKEALRLRQKGETGEGTVQVEGGWNVWDRERLWPLERSSTVG